MPNLVVPLEKQFKNVTSFDFTVTIIENASGVMIDEFSGRYTSAVRSKFAEFQEKYTYTSYHPIDSTEIGPDEGEDVSVAYIATGVLGGCVVLGVVIVLVVTAIIIAWRKSKNSGMQCHYTHLYSTCASCNYCTHIYFT